MSVRGLYELAALVRRERDTLMSQWRARVRQLPSARDLDTPTLNDHVPSLLDELVAALEKVSDQTIAEALIAGTPPAHGLERQRNGFDIVEVVSEYNILRECIHELAERNGLPLQGQALQILNRVLDESIGLAVQTFATQQALEVQERREEYLAFVAHDLRTPLNAISLAARVLERSLSGKSAPRDSTPQTGQMLKTLQRNTQQLQGLVERVLKESANVQTESGVKLERRHFDLWPLVEDLIHDLHPVAGTSSTRLVNRIPEELTVYADAALLRRTFQNLVGNAIKYTPRGEVVIGARKTDRGVECWVRDNGSGMTQDRLDALFGEPEQNDQRDPIGLGLAIVKTFVEAHGGTLHIDSKPGAGSMFSFTLPGAAGG